MPDLPDRLRSDKGFDRLVFFSDAVVAIAISLLILPVVDEVSSGNENVSELFDKNGGRLLAFAVSFLVIARFWMVHHEVFERIEGYTPQIVWANMLWLATIVFLPLPTEMLGDGAADRAVRAFYIGSVLAVALALVLVNLMMAAAPQIHRDPDDRPMWYGGIAVSICIAAALVIAVTIPLIGMWAMFLVALAGPVQSVLFERRLRTPAAAPPP